MAASCALNSCIAAGRVWGTGEQFTDGGDAVLGIPLYVSSDPSLPMVATPMNSDMGTGAAMAFLVTGAGISIGTLIGAIAPRYIATLICWPSPANHPPRRWKRT